MGRIRTTSYRISLRRYGLRAERPLRIGVLADLHNRIYRSDVDALVQAVKDARCDLILSAGDLVVMKAGHFATSQALDLIERLAGRLPVLTANGNHETRMRRLVPEEYEHYLMRLKQSGAVNLVNESRDLRMQGVPLRISGLELEGMYYRHPRTAELDAEVIRQSIGERASGTFQILLAHHPRYFPAYAEWGADLTLAGHLHGGIVRLPLLGGVISPDVELFPRYDYGLYGNGRSRMIVSAGLGTHTIHLRVNNPAELVVAELW